MSSKVLQFSKLLCLDRSLQCVVQDLVFQQLRKTWVRLQRTNGLPHPVGTYNEFQAIFLPTGSVAEGMVSSRLFREPQRVIGPQQSIDLELDMMIVLATFDSEPAKQNKFVEPIAALPGFYRVRKFHSNEGNLLEFITPQVKKRFTPLITADGGQYLTGGIIKEGLEKIGTFRDKGDLIRMWSALILNVEITSLNVEVDTERNGPAVTAKFGLKENEQTLLEFSMDGVACIKLTAWPTECEAWKNRHRAWPNSDLVQEVIKEGCHLVPKMSPERPDEEQWRLSFSVAEKKLALARSDGHQLTYYVFKSLYYAVIKVLSHHDQTLPSYLAKTLMLWACEEMPMEEWSVENLESNIQILFMKLQTALQAGRLDHYFLPEINLLRSLPENLLEQAAHRIEEIIENPLDCITSELLEKTGELLERHVTFGKNIEEKLSSFVELEAVKKGLADLLNSNL